jgi:two-component system chemotaxis response regulator CheB
MQQLTKESSKGAKSKVSAPRALVVIGATTGGPAALAQVLPKFPRDFPASIVVVQLMRPGFMKLLARQLNGLSELPVEEAEHHQPLIPGAAFLAPGDHSLTLDRSGNEKDNPFFIRTEIVSDSVERMRRRVNDAMVSAASIFGPRTVGVLLTGVGDDGREGMKEIRNCGGKTIAQDESSSIVFDMPRAAIAAGVVDEVLPIWSISDRIIEIVGDS